MAKKKLEQRIVNEDGVSTEPCYIVLREKGSPREEIVGVITGNLKDLPIILESIEKERYLQKSDYYAKWYLERKAKKDFREAILKNLEEIQFTPLRNCDGGTMRLPYAHPGPYFNNRELREEYSFNYENFNVSYSLERSNLWSKSKSS